MNTPTGQRLVDFYSQGDKQVRDIHTEARRLADIKGGKPSTAPAGSSAAENEKTMETVPGTEMTTCQCGGNTGTCPCAEGKCACSGCAKSGASGEAATTAPSSIPGGAGQAPPTTEKTA